MGCNRKGWGGGALVTEKTRKKIYQKKNFFLETTDLKVFLTLSRVSSATKNAAKNAVLTILVT